MLDYAHCQVNWFMLFVMNHYNRNGHSTKPMAYQIRNRCLNFCQIVFTYIVHNLDNCNEVVRIVKIAKDNYEYKV